MPDGKTVYGYLLSNRSGASAEVINIGAIVRTLEMPDRNGQLQDIVLGCDTVSDYLEQSPFFGAIVGRYGNRIQRGRFTLDGREYSLNVNNGDHHLHGGPSGFHQRYWEIEEADASDGTAVRAFLHSPDGEEGYPGDVDLEIVIALTEENALRFTYTGTCNKTTILNPTHHGYFNLSGDPTATILDHVLEIGADAITPVDKGLIPTGELMPVAGTPMDFRAPQAVGNRIDAEFDQLVYGGGYDHNYVLRDFEKGKVRTVARVHHPGSGRVMTVLTDQPGMQFYAGNFLNGAPLGKNGAAYPKRGGLCLEAQHYPDSPNQPQFPSVVLRPGETYRQVTAYRFGVA